MFAPAVAYRYRERMSLGRMLVIAGLALGGVLYLFAVNRASVQGYRMNEIEKYVEEVRLQNQNKELELASQQSLPYIQSQLTNKPFVSVKNVTYIESAAPRVALK